MGFDELMQNADVPTKVTLYNVVRLYPTASHLCFFQIHIQVRVGTPRYYVMIGELHLPWPVWDANLVMSHLS